MFEREVYPVLLTDCAFSQCHGAPQRFFKVFGPGRTRLTTADGSDPLALEIQASYEHARSMLVGDGQRPYYRSLLLLKPLDVGLGGIGHGGADVYGRNVYRSAQNPGYATLVRWALSGAAQAGIVTSPTSAGNAGPPQAGNAALAGTTAVPQAGSTALAGSPAQAGSTALAGSPAQGPLATTVTSTPALPLQGTAGAGPR
jgi:hypothetical protein